jgi:7-carboxy-7-deazaguanine synthase
MIYYQNIFTSIQGEGYDSGKPCTFVRLYGCNLHCKYCDQIQTEKDRKTISVKRMVELVRSKHIQNVCITGGEPLLQSEIFEVIYELVKANYKVSIETNGCCLIPDDPYARSFKYVMDVKGPSSGMVAKNIYSNLDILHAEDEVKFLISDRKDYDFALKTMQKHPIKSKILFSPVMAKGKATIGKELVHWMIEDKLNNVKLQIQLHKVVGVM